MLDEQRLVRAVGSGRRRGPEARWRRAEARPVELKAGANLQITTFDERQAFTTNRPWADAGPDVDALLAEPFMSWHVELIDETLQVQATKRGGAVVSVTPVAQPRPVDASHDRVKQRLVDPNARFLQILGVTTAAGVVKVGRRDKFRQVEEFVRALDPVVRDALAGGRLTRDRPVRAVDLGCGNAYLTFAAYQYLAQVRGLSVEMVGVDQLAQARQHNEAAASRLGWGDRLTFVDGDIASAVVEGPVDVVLALHACDTATDEALARAVGWQAPVVMAAPCCHHDIQRQLKATKCIPRPYEVVTRHGILRERFADILTDALRAALLRQAGYRTDVMEFVDTRHTPRNLLLRAVRTGAEATPEEVAEYRRLVAEWGVRPRLADLLEDDGTLPK